MTGAGRILVVDDEQKMRRLLEMALRNMGHEVAEAADGEEALARFNESPFDLVLTDMRMPRMNGLQLLRNLRERGEEVPVVMLTAHGTVESAVEAMKLGAVDYIIRPFEMETVELAVTRALAMGAVQRENRYLRDEVDRGWGEFIGRSSRMQRLYELIQQAAPARSSVFIAGETGTGKELVARAIHNLSSRKNSPFVVISCAAIPATLMESELFGHTRGAFT
ncbi:MAG TPA: response regulator, partial [Gammaproteobacteria bacterium]|nr:response regulator [Gammaproteobacteria bacterium]